MVVTSKKGVYKTFDLFSKGIVTLPRPLSYFSHSFPPLPLPSILTSLTPTTSKPVKMSADLRTIAMMDPADVMVALQAYYGADKGYYFGGYIAGYVLPS
jgi:hypothetical protein